MYNKLNRVFTTHTQQHKRVYLHIETGYVRV